MSEGSGKAQETAMNERLIRQVWRDMHLRCNDPTHFAYKWYGQKGITVCTRWHTFPAFYADMGATCFIGASLDRTDNNQGYSPENCKWIPKADQTSVGRQSLRHNNRTGMTGVEEVRPGTYRVLIRERGYPRDKGPKRTLYCGPSFEEACAIRTAWVEEEQKIPASRLII
jgi:hypothetical protein